MNAEVSRRGFLKSAGLAGLAAASVGAFGSLPQAHADETTSAQAETAENPYIAALGENTQLLPVDKKIWDAERGPIGFEDREIPAEEISRTEECDLVVIGGGISGVVAAKKAAREGARVIVIEKMTKGRSAWESIGGYNSKAQQEIDNVPDPAEYAEIILRAAYNRVPAEVTWAFVNKSGETIDFVQEMLDEANSGIKIYSTKQDPYPYAIDMIQGEHKFELPEEYHWTSWMFGPPVMHALTEAVKADPNIDIRFLTSGVQLIQDESGRVTGVIAKDSEGYYRIDGAKGVLLATGSYTANPEMMQAWVRPEDYATSGNADPSIGVTGDGHMMGLMAGAQMDPIPHTVMNFGVPMGFFTAWGCSFTVNPSGKRFMNESLPMNYTSNAINTETRAGGRCWCIFDQAMMDAHRADGSATGETIAAALENETLVEGETIADLAAALGMDSAILEQTVETWNSYFEGDSRVDSEFRRDLTTAVPMGDGPYYASPIRSMVYAVVSGLTINGNAQVLDKENKVIDGLYAAGNAAGSMFAGTYPRHLPATSVGRAATFGYIAAAHAVKGE